MSPWSRHHGGSLRRSPWWPEVVWCILPSAANAVRTESTVVMDDGYCPVLLSRSIDYQSVIKIRAGICTQGTIKHYWNKTFMPNKGLSSNFLRKHEAALSVTTPRIFLTPATRYGALPAILFQKWLPTSIRPASRTSYPLERTPLAPWLPLSKQVWRLTRGVLIELVCYRVVGKKG